MTEHPDPQWLEKDKGCFSLPKGVGAGSRGQRRPLHSHSHRDQPPSGFLLHHPSTWFASVSWQPHGQGICGRWRYHIHISKSREGEEDERAATPFPSAFIKQPFWKLSLATPTHISSCTSLAGAQRTTPSCREAGKRCAFRWA